MMVILLFLCLVVAPVFGQVDCAALVLLVGQQQQLLELQTGILYQTTLEGYSIRDADWDANTQTLFFLGYPTDDSPDDIQLYKLEFNSTEPERIFDFATEVEVTDVEVSSNGATLALGVMTHGEEPLDYGVGITLLDVETGELGGTTEIAVNGETRGLSLLEMEWSPAGDYLALTTMAVGPEETTGLLDTACLLQQRAICEVDLLLPDVNRGYMNPTWSPDGSALAFRCLHVGITGICVWDAATDHVSELEAQFTIRHDLDWLPCDQQFIAYTSEDDPTEPLLLVFDLTSDESLYSAPFEQYDFRELVVIPESDLPRWIVATSDT